MEIPPEVVAESLSGFSVCYFKNAEHDPDAPPHYYVTVPINDDSSLLLCFVTSQIENKSWYYNKTNKDALASLVGVNKSMLPFLKKDSFIDCNQPVLVRKKDFGKIVDFDHKFKVVTRKIPAGLKKRIVKAINDSPVVKPYIKKLVTDS